MDRRSFLRALGVSATIASFGNTRAFTRTHKPQVAITMDDPRLQQAHGLTGEQINRKILDALDRHKVKAALFVCGMRIDSDAGRALLGTWSDAKHTLGNHTYSHWYLHSKRITLPAFCDDIARGESVASTFPQFRKLFRFPFFKEGETAEKRDGVRRFLSNKGYRMGRATIDASDWAIDARLLARLQKQSDADLAPYRDFYLAHIAERSRYYDDLAHQVLGGPVRHTLLIHHNLLNALFLDDLLRSYRDKGWQVISADDAYRDPVYQRQPEILPAGESLIWALAKEAGKFESILRYPGEDEPYEKPRMDALNL